MLATGIKWLMRGFLPVLVHHGVNVKWRTRGLPHGRWASIFEAVTALGSLVNTGLLILLSVPLQGHLAGYMPVFGTLLAIGCLGLIAYVPARAYHEHKYSRKYRLAAVGMEL